MFPRPIPGQQDWKPSNLDRFLRACRDDGIPSASALDRYASCQQRLGESPISSMCNKIEGIHEY